MSCNNLNEAVQGRKEVGNALSIKCNDMAENGKDVDEVAFARMMRLCSRSEHCSSDILSRLRNLGVQSPARILDELIKQGFVDDRRFASAFARDKSSLQGWGSLKIKLALQTKGVSDSIIEEALSCVDGGRAEDKLESLLKGKLRSLSGVKDEEELRRRLLRYALGRGYDYSSAREMINRILYTEKM